MSKITVLILFFISSILYAEIEEFQATETERTSYSLEKVCNLSGVTDLLFATVSSAGQIDCMGKMVEIKNFCLKEHGKSNKLLRGYLLGKEVVCLVGRDLKLTIKCTGEHTRFCQSGRDDCLFLKELYAYQHELVHYSLFKDEKQVNCHFTTSQK